MRGGGDRGKLVLLGAGAAALAAAAYYLSSGEVPLDMKLAYIRKFGPIDLKISAREGWMPGILTGWSAMEGEWGTSALTKPAPTGGNNVFGVKAGPTWRRMGRPFVTLLTHENIDDPATRKKVKVPVQAAFRAYNSWEESAEDLVRLLKIESIYRPALDALDRKDVAGFLAGITASKYSTYHPQKPGDPKDYGDLILSFVRQVSQATA